MNCELRIVEVSALIHVWYR